LVIQLTAVLLTSLFVAYNRRQELGRPAFASSQHWTSQRVHNRVKMKPPPWVRLEQATDGKALPSSFVMNQRLISLCLVLSLIGFATWVLWPEPLDIYSPGQSATDDVTVTESAGPIADAETGLKPKASRDLSASDLEANYPSWTTPPDRERDLHGVVLGPEGQPFAGAKIEVWRPAKQGMATLDLVQSKSALKVMQAVSNQQGEFRAPLSAGSVYDLSATAEGLASSLVKGCQAGEKLIVRLKPVTTVYGQVTIQKTGEPLAGCNVRIFGMGGRGSRSNTVTDAEGRYRLEDIAVGDYFLEVRPTDWQMPGWQDVTTKLGRDLEFNFELEEGFTLHGKVVDAVSKLAIANAEVSDSWVFRKTVRTNKAGEFTLRGLENYDGEFEVHARAAGYGLRAKSGSKKDIGNPFAMELLAAHTVIGTLLNAQGKPVKGAYVAAVASTEVEDVQQIDWRACQSEADGRFHIANVRADVQHTLQVRKQGFGSLLYELPPHKPQATQVDMGVIYLPAASRIGGRIHNEDGDGVAGIQVQLTGWNSDRGNYGRPPDEGLSHYIGTTKLRSDDLGRFRFSDLSEGVYRLAIMRSGMAQIDPLKIAVGIAQSKDVEILVPKGGEISGTVLDPDGNPFEGAYVRLRAEKETVYGSTSVQSSKDGKFNFTGLVPGNYGIEISEPWGRDHEEPLLPASLTNLQPGRLDVVLQFKRGQYIRGQVVDEQGMPIRHAVVRASLPGRPSVSTDFTGSDGKFTLRIPIGEIVDLFADPPYGSRGVDGGQIIWSPDGSEYGLVVPGISAGTNGLVLRLPWKLP
jgi:protocatechuate 3,4-dioxygenase beta subunit